MKLTKHAWTLWAIALAAFLVLALGIRFVHNTVYWIAFGSTIVTFGICAAVFFRAFRRKQELWSKVLGWPIFKVAYIALTIQLVLGFALMATSALCPTKVVLCGEILFLLFVLFAVTVRDAAREAVIRSEERMNDSTATWKAIRIRANAIAAQSGHPELARLAEEIRYADPVPTSLDGEIANMIELLSSYADAQNIKKAFALLEQRRQLAKITK